MSKKVDYQGLWKYSKGVQHPPASKQGQMYMPLNIHYQINYILVLVAVRWRISNLDWPYLHSQA